MQRYAVTYRNLLIENRRMCSIPNVNNRIVLHIGTITNANEMYIAANRAVTPY